MKPNPNQNNLKTILLLPYNAALLKERAYAKQYNDKFTALYTVAGWTVSLTTDPLSPLIFEDTLLIFQTRNNTEWFIKNILQRYPLETPVSKNGERQI